MSDACDRNDSTAVLLADIEEYLNVTWQDERTDRKFRNMMMSGIAYINDKYGEAADYLTDGFPRTLLFEYVRYMRDNALDVFENNYCSMILSMQNRKAVDALNESMENA